MATSPNRYNHFKLLFLVAKPYPDTYRLQPQSKTHCTVNARRMQFVFVLVYLTLNILLQVELEIKAGPANGLLFENALNTANSTAR